MKHVAVIGAGISGLACAFRLNELKKRERIDMDVSVFEAAPRCGGSIGTELKDGYVLEKGPDSFIAEKPWVADLSKRLGIDGQLIDTRPEGKKIYIVKRGKFVPMPEGFYLIAPTQIPSFMATALFSPLGKMRMASELLIPKRRSVQDESIASFIRRRFGREVLDRVGQPMIAGIHSGDPEQLSIAATMPQFTDLEDRHGSVIRGLLKNARRPTAHKKNPGSKRSLFLTYRNGMSTLIEALGSQLGTAVHLDAPVTIDRHPSGKWAVHLPNAPVRLFDAVCLSVSARHAAAMLRRTDGRIWNELQKVRFESMATINLAYRSSDLPRPMSGSGFVVPALEKRSITACTFSSQKFDGRSPEGHVLIRVFSGGAFGKKYFEMSDPDLKSAVLKDLKDLLGIRAEPTLCVLARHAQAMPQYDVGHQARVSNIGNLLKDHPGLHLTGSSYQGAGISNCVRHAELEAEMILNGLVRERRSVYGL